MSPSTTETAISADERVAATAARHFGEDAIGSVVKVALDVDDYRHLIFSNHVRGVGRIHIITFPGHLFVTGDRGSWSFQRDDADLLQLFADNASLSYWTRKLDPDTHQFGGREEYSPAAFVEVVKAQRDDDLAYWSNRLAPDALAGIAAAYDDLAATALDHSSASAAYDALFCFSHETDADGETLTFEFGDASSCQLGSWDYRFAYVCRALSYVAAVHSSLNQDS